MREPAADKSKTEVEADDRALFDRIARQYARKDSTPSSRISRKYQLLATLGDDLLRRGKLKRVVEIACGIGASAEYLRGHYDDYVGVDHSPEMIDIAAWFNRDNPAARFVCGNAKEKIDLGGPADLVLAVGALHHITELDLLFDTMKEYAAPGARFVAVEPFRGNPIIGAMRFLRAKIDRGYSADQTFFSRAELRDLLARNAMRDVELVNQGFFTPPFAQVIVPPQFLTAPLSRIATWLDRGIDRLLVPVLGPLSWNVVIRARFPD